MTFDLREVAAGLLFIAIGGFFAIDSLLFLRIGTAFSMGPGYFPLAMGTLLVVLGLVIALRGVNAPAVAFGPVPWRGGACVIGAVVFFGATVRGLGIVPALGVATMLAAKSSPQITWLGAALLSAGLTAFSAFVFVYLLNVPVPMLGRWIGF
jgi:hypothetical protein